MTNTKVFIFSGNEGPRYDPYSYEEITVTINGNEITYHGGLGDWLEINGVRQDIHGEFDVVDTFKKLTGAYPGQWKRWEERRRAKTGYYQYYENPRKYE